MGKREQAEEHASRPRQVFTDLGLEAQAIGWRARPTRAGRGQTWLQPLAATTIRQCCVGLRVLKFVR